MGLGLTNRVPKLSKSALQMGWLPARGVAEYDAGWADYHQGLSWLPPGPTNAGLTAARVCPGYYQGLPWLFPGLALTTIRATASTCCVGLTTGGA